MGLKFRWPSSGSTETGTRKAAAAARESSIRGVRNDVPVSFEPGGAVPGDRIVGVLTPGEGIRIFQIHSPRLSEFEHERWIDVTWDVDPEAPERFPARIMVTVLNEPGTLAQIAQVIGEADGNIDNLRMLHRGADFTEMQVEVEVWDLSISTASSTASQPSPSSARSSGCSSSRLPVQFALQLLSRHTWRPTWWPYSPCLSLP